MKTNEEIAQALEGLKSPKFFESMGFTLLGLIEIDLAIEALRNSVRVYGGATAMLALTKGEVQALDGYILAAENEYGESYEPDDVALRNKVHQLVKRAYAEDV